MNTQGGLNYLDISTGKHFHVSHWRISVQGLYCHTVCWKSLSTRL